MPQNGLSLILLAGLVLGVIFLLQWIWRRPYSAGPVPSLSQESGESVVTSRPLMSPEEATLFNLIKLAAQDHMLVLAKMPILSILSLGDNDEEARKAVMRTIQPVRCDVILAHPDFAGLHFTGSTGVFQEMWKTIGANIQVYKTYPRIVGETGGKDFIMVHKSANAKEVATAISGGAFEYQGQKCSAASRCYIPSNLWDDVKKYVLEDLKTFKMGPVEDFGNFVNAVIDEKAFNSMTG